jgi:hypothetical protein
MLDHIIADDIAQSISIPISATQDRLLPPKARIASCLRAHPTGFALLISEQTFQKQACIRRNTILIEQRTYPFLDLTEATPPTAQASLQSTLAASTIFESWLPMDSETCRKGNCSARYNRVWVNISG